MSVYTDLVAIAEDLGSYDDTGRLWILKRPSSKIDLTLCYDAESDTFVAEVRDGKTRVECNADRRVEAIQNALDSYLDERLVARDVEKLEQLVA